MNNSLEQYIRTSLDNTPILLMTHLVLGYPSLDVNREVIKQMVANGVDLIELQIPFSEPVADGSIILKANQNSLINKTKVRDCLDFAAKMGTLYDIPFLFMTYYNILYKYGLEAFVKKVANIGMAGFIIPDLPPEEGQEYLELSYKEGLAPIQIYAPTSTPERMRFLSDNGAGFIYCVARRGVTGTKTEFDTVFTSYINQCRESTSLPLAVGFGIRDRDDVSSLEGKADIAVIGSETIRLVDENGTEAVGPFIAGLR